ncbi:MAG: hypothetical protein AAF684_10795 [Pseudomonadota bacterium]
MARRARGKKQAPPASSGVFNFKNLLTVLVSIAFLIFFFPTCLVLGVSLIPSIVAFVVDQSKGKFLFRCVLSMNACGALPALTDLWVAGHDLDAVTTVVTDVWYYLYAYGAAGFGWVLYGGVPKLIASYVSLKAQNRVKELREFQNKLIDEWGQDVARQVRGAGAVGGAEPLGMPKDGEDAEAEEEPLAVGPPKTEGDALVSSAESKPRVGQPGVGPPIPVAPGKMQEQKANAFDDLADDELKPGAAPPGLPAFE